MTIRRPILDRKHRPRWQDELRTQQLIVAGFAVAIAVAVGILGSTMWNTYYDNHLRQVAVVNGTSLNADAIHKRVNIIGSELTARGVDFNSQLGGARDSVLQQQLQVVQDQLNTVSQTATDSLVNGTFLGQRAGQVGLSVSDAEVTTEVNRRQTLPTRLELSVITVNALPADAPAGIVPTDAQLAAAKQKAAGILADLKGGASFASTADAKSDDATTKALHGKIGLVDASDGTYGALFAKAKDGHDGDLFGPFLDAKRYVILRLDSRHDSGPFKVLTQLLASSEISPADYRAYVHDELLRAKFRTYFGSQVIQAYQPQQHVAQIFISGDQGVPLPKIRLRHLLVQPIPGAQDQTAATAEQWQAALTKANELYAKATAANADWCALAKFSDDPGSRNQCGDLGWYDPTTSQFAADFKAAVAGLAVGEITKPAKTQFGYHVIEATQQRTSAQDQADQLVKDLRAHPDTFAAVAKAQSEDPTSAAKGGDIGWVARYEQVPALETAIFGLTKKNQVSDPVDSNNGFYIFQLLESSSSRWVDYARLASIRNAGFDRWLTEQKAGVQIWVDPSFQSSTATPASGTGGGSVQ